MIDITIEENKAVLDKININAKTFNVQNQFSTIKCYQSLTNITNLEAKGVNIIKIHKTILKAKIQDAESNETSSKRISLLCF